MENFFHTIEKNRSREKKENRQLGEFVKTKKILLIEIFSVK